MKKVIPLKIQKVLSFIPYLNVSVFIIWYYNSFATRKEWPVLMKSFSVLAIVAGLMFFLFEMLIAIFSSSVSLCNAIEYMRIYFIPLAVSQAAIKGQRKYFGLVE